MLNSELVCPFCHRYKIIRYQDNDATEKIDYGPNHFLEVTTPAVAGMLCLIFAVLLCAR